MSVNEPSEERVNAAARAMQREDPVPMQMLTFDEICDLARAALIADAPALIEVRIDEARATRLEFNETLKAPQEFESLRLFERYIVQRLAALQADLDKERGNGC